MNFACNTNTRSTCLLFLLLGHQFMVTRNDELCSAFLLLLKIHILIACFKVSGANREQETYNRVRFCSFLVAPLASVCQPCPNSTVQMTLQLRKQNILQTQVIHHAVPKFTSDLPQAVCPHHAAGRSLPAISEIFASFPRINSLLLANTLPCQMLCFNSRLSGFCHVFEQWNRISLPTTPSVLTVVHTAIRNTGSAYISG